MRHREFRCRARRSHANVPVGLILLVVGGALLARQLGVVLPEWLFSWEVLLITIGLLIGITNRFRDFGWAIMIAVGLIFLADDVYPDMSNFIWPAAIILLGLVIVLKPKRQKKNMIVNDAAVINTDAAPVTDSMAVEQDVLDLVSVFGGIKRIVLSKNFKGGEIVCVFGGAEVNLSQADFTSPIKLEVVAIFGGLKLIVPPNWEVRSESAAVLGGIDDKRDPAAMTNPEKVIILDASVVFGGIEINSY